MNLNGNRRHLFMLAATTLLSSALAKTAFAAKGASEATVDEFLRTSQLSTQIDLLMESIIKKNPEHLKMSAAQIDQLKDEARVMMKDLYVQLVNREFTQQDLAEMIHHFSLPAEKKWNRFNQLAVNEAKLMVNGRLHSMLNPEKKQS